MRQDGQRSGLIPAILSSLPLYPPRSQGLDSSCLGNSLAEGIWLLFLPFSLIAKLQQMTGGGQPVGMPLPLALLCPAAY